MTAEQEVALVRAENAELREQLAVAIARIAELEAQLNQRGDPPAFVKPNRPKAAGAPQPRKKRAAEHNTSRKRMVATRSERHALERCPECAYRLSGESLDYSREVVELPPPQPVEVIEHQVVKRWCPHCAKWRSPQLDLTGQVFGQGRIGVRIASVIAYLRTTLRLPVRLVQSYLQTLHGLDLSIGEIAELAHAVRQHLQPLTAQLKQAVQASPVVHGDETGWRENGQNGWAWAFVTAGPAAVRYYEYDPGRSHFVPQRVLGPNWQGCLVTDFYAAYNLIPGRHQRCWVHLLRDLHALKEAPAATAEVLAWVVAVRQLYEDAQTWLAAHPAPSATARTQQYLHLHERTCRLGQQYAQTPAQPCAVLAKRLLRHQDELFQFVLLPQVPADNNLAERSIRPLVVLRVWGGGFYEDERFYDLCDRYGILVWQDFIFSCSIYPLDDPAFVENVRVEVVENVRRLRHRASLALWCGNNDGNNEMEQGWAEWGWDRPELEDLKAAYDRFFHHTLAEWCAAEDPDHAYWPSSPSSDSLFENPNSQRQGDAHYWDVWHKREPFTAYRSQYPRFMSEFGFQALPPLETIRTYAAESDWKMTSYIMEQHQKNESGNALMVSQMLDTFRMPKDFESLVYLSMVLQAEGIRYGVEHWRRHPARVSGTLYWQLNDCWPVASWSSLDYFGRWKALHYVARRFYAPLLLSIEDAPPCQSIFISSDLNEEWQGKVRWALTTLNGEIRASDEIAARVEPSGVTAAESLDFYHFLDDDTRRDLVFVAELWQGYRRLATQTAFFVPTKHLSLADPKINARMTLRDGLVVIDLTARSLARLVECSLAGAEAVFSDNYFDLPAQKVIRSTCPLPEEWDLAMAQAALDVRSVYDTYFH